MLQMSYLIYSKQQNNNVQKQICIGLIKGYFFRKEVCLFDSMSIVGVENFESFLPQLFLCILIIIQKISENM